jgi:hypothetical protein
LADDLLKELLTSPLEPTKRKRARDTGESGDGVQASGAGETGTERVPVGSWPWIVGAALLGASIVLVGYLVGAEESQPVTVPTTTTIVATAGASDGSPSGLPDDYTAVGGRVGLRVERILLRSDGVFITLTSVVENSLEPSQSTGFQGGLWTLVLSDGRRITSSNESFDALAPGTVSVYFPPEGIVAEDIEALEINGIANRLTNVLTTQSVTATELPADGSAVGISFDPESFDIDVNVDLTIDAFTMSAGGGDMTWSLSGEAGASLLPVLTLDWSDGRSTIMATRTQTSGFVFSHPSIPSPLLTTGGEFVFDPPAPGDLGVGLSFAATLELQTTWATYSPIVATIPVEGAQIAVVR